MNITSRRVHGGEVLGATPGHPLLVPALSAAPGLSMSRQQALLDLQAIQRIPGLAGYWSADPAYAYQDSAGYTPATVGGVVGQVRDISNAATPVARRNLLMYSEDFSKAEWSKTRVTVTSDTTVAPDGTTTADTLTADGSSSTSKAIVYSTTQSTFPVTFSIFVYAGTNNYVQACTNQATNGYVTYDIASLTTSATTATGTISDVGGGWRRCTFTVTSGATLNNLYLCLVSSSTAARYESNTLATYVYLWGAQLELGAEATPYQKIVTGTGDVFAPGNHAYQQTTSKKPILKRTPTSNVYWLNSDADDELTATLGNLGAACTVAKAGAEGVTFTEGVTISSTYNIAPAYGFNGDVAIFNRALTVTEKALVTRYMSRGVPVLGSNLVTNGDFENGTTGWATDDATLEIISGAAKVTTLVNYGRIFTPSLNLAVGGHYQMTGEVLEKGDSTYQSGIAISTSSNGGGVPVVSSYRALPGSFSIVFGAATATLYAVCANNSATAGQWSVLDNISVKAIL